MDSLLFKFRVVNTISGSIKVSLCAVYELGEYYHINTTTLRTRYPYRELKVLVVLLTKFLQNWNGFQNNNPLLKIQNKLPEESYWIRSRD